MAGISSGPSLSDKVNSKLADSAKLVRSFLSSFVLSVTNYFFISRPTKLLVISELPSKRCCRNTAGA